MKNFLLLIVLLVVVIIAVVLIVIYQPSVATDTSSSLPGDAFFAPNNAYAVSRISDDTTGNTVLMLTHTATDDEYVLDLADDASFYGLMWSADGMRLFWSKVQDDEAYTNIFYIDLAALDPTAVTEVVTADAEFFAGLVLVTNVQNNVLLLEKDGASYSLDLTQGVDAVPVQVEE